MRISEIQEQIWRPTAVTYDNTHTLKQNIIPLFEHAQFLIAISDFFRQTPFPSASVETEHLASWRFEFPVDLARQPELPLTHRVPDVKI